ncbi:MAG: DUF11 domain-containing protein, partial [Candidatus Peribacteraceae bacterium]|nr:DUF11 domain-containing protein [Candidatus Peribacteraceae bacterium]
MEKVQKAKKLFASVTLAFVLIAQPGVTSLIPAFPEEANAQVPATRTWYADGLGIRAFYNSIAVQRGYTQISTAWEGQGMVSNDAVTAQKICEFAGYKTVISRDCYEYGSGGGRCNFTSCGNNTMGVWGTSANNMQIAGACGYTWLSSLTCGDPICTTNADCDDGNASTTDVCLNPGTLQSSCQHTTVAQCSDGIDNDGDGATDYPNDPSCSDADDNDETYPKTACEDGIDNDGDGLADYPNDPGCTSRLDMDERNANGPQCDNGADDDLDGTVDYPADTGCTGPTDDSEQSGTVTQCSDGVDNDGDGKIDYNGVPCNSACAAQTIYDSSVNSPVKGQLKTFTVPCDGTINANFYDDNAFIRLTKPNGTRQIVMACDNEAHGYYCGDSLCCASSIPQHGAIICTRDNAKTATLYAGEGLGCPGGKIDNYNIVVKQGDALAMFNSDWAAGHGKVTFTPSSTCTPVPADPDCTGPNDDSEASTAQCSDGIDNDGDGLVDYPSDPGCSSATDNDEHGNTDCDDGVDNDGDGTMDFPHDPACSSVKDDSETKQCDDNIDNEGDSKEDYPQDPGCTDKYDNDESGNDTADVQITKSGPSTAQQGGTVTYTIKIKNLGPHYANGVNVMDTVPAGLTFNPAQSSPECGAAGSTIYCNDNSFGYGAPAGGWRPIAGDWDSNGKDTIGLYDPSSSTFYLRNSNTAGYADITLAFSGGGVGWIPLAGDWDHNGRDGVALFNPSTKVVLLRNTLTSGGAENQFTFDSPAGFTKAIAGDWNDNGTDTIGLYNPTTSHFLLRNTLATGATNDIDVAYGVPGAGWLPVSGDWDDDGQDTVGMFLPDSSYFYLANNNLGGHAEMLAGFGTAGAADQIPVMGDWNGNGRSGIGVYAGNSSTFYIRNAVSTGTAFTELKLNQERTYTLAFTVSSAAACNSAIANTAIAETHGSTDPSSANNTSQTVSTTVTCQQTPQCRDGIDNDGDGATDYPNDFSCSSPDDDDETNPKAQCQDGIDNDGNGLADYPSDPGCSSRQDNDEDNPVTPQCRDGIGK